jgi:hypothetical protein
VPTVSFSIQSVALRRITESLAEIQIILSEPGSLSIEYKPSLSKKATTITAPGQLKVHTVVLPDLTKNATYHFRISSTRESGVKIRSDLYSFTTASAPPTHTVPAFARLSSQGALISSLNLNNPATLVLPTKSQLEIILELSLQSAVKSFTLLQNFGEWQSQTAFEKTIGQEYLARFTPQQTGTGLLSAQVQDYYGNLVTLPIAQIDLVPPLRLMSTANKPIEFGRIFVQRYNPLTHLFETIPANTLLRNNPVFTDVAGEAPFILPFGTYQLDISAPGFRAATFTVTIATATSYPVLTLETDTSLIMGSIHNSLYVANNVLQSLLTDIRGSAVSQTMYSLAAFLTTSFFLVLSSLALSAKTHISIWKLPSYIWHRTNFFARFSHIPIYKIHGQILAKTSQRPISRALVTLRDGTTEAVVATFSSDRQGYFHWRMTSELSLEGTVTAVGFVPYSFTTDQLQPHGGLVISLEETPSVADAKAHRLLSIAEMFLGSLFETLLLLSLILQAFFFTHSNVFMEAVLVTGAMINLTVWSLYISTPHLHQPTQLKTN